MDLVTLKTLLGWCTVINYLLLALWSIIFLVAGNAIYRIHSRWFPIPRETHTVVMYCLLGGFKLLVILFNLVPWLALTLMGVGEPQVIEGIPTELPPGS